MLLPISLATEGLDDEAIARKICTSLAVPVAYSYPSGGKSRLDPRIPGYNKAALHAPWLVLRDLDNDSPCPSSLCEALVQDRSPMMLLRIPIRTIESWLIADPSSLSTFLGISRDVIPINPDELVSPKNTMITLARRSRKREILQTMLPQKGTSTSVGPGYTAKLIEYSADYWDPLRASNASPSLERCLEAIRRLYCP
jgi:hypothetical protein